MKKVSINTIKDALCINFNVNREKKNLKWVFENAFVV